MADVVISKVTLRHQFTQALVGLSETPTNIYEFKCTAEQCHVNPWAFQNAKQIDGLIAILEHRPGGSWMRMTSKTCNIPGIPIFLEFQIELSKRVFSKLRQLLPNLLLRFGFDINMGLNGQPDFNNLGEVVIDMSGAHSDPKVSQAIFHIGDQLIVNQILENQVRLTTQWKLEIIWTPSITADIFVRNQAPLGISGFRKPPEDLQILLDGGEVIRCNRVVLVEGPSNRIREILMNSEDNEPVHFPRISSTALNHLLHYLYGGELFMEKLTFDIIIELIQATTIYQLDQLREDMEDLLVLKSKADLNVEDVLKLFLLSERDANLSKFVSHFLGILIRYPRGDLKQCETFRALEEPQALLDRLYNNIQQKWLQNIFGIN